MKQIIPAILVHSSQEYLDCLHAIDHVTPLVHIDIADGIFVPHTTWADANTIAGATAIDIELHLMVADPVREAKKWKDIPQVKRFIIHAESNNLAETIPQLCPLKRDIAVALNPETPIQDVRFSLPDITGVQFMTVHPGKQGNPFEPSVIDNIRSFHAAYPNGEISVDGHVDETTIPELVSVGATRLCVGSDIFHTDETPKNRYKTLLALTKKI